MIKILSVCSLFGIFAYINAQVETIEENFSSFNDLNFPQKGWNKKDAFVENEVLIVTRFEPKRYIRTQNFDKTEPVYIITPELASIDGEKSLTFSTWTRRGTGRVQVGVSKTSDTETIAKNFVAISQEYKTDIVEPNKLTYSVSIPKSDAKHIVFKLIPDEEQIIIFLDDVYYKNSENLSTQSISYKNTPNIVVDNNGQLVLKDSNDFISAKIFNTSGNIVIDQRITHHKIDISHLNVGVYIITIQHKNGSISTSKFIKTE